MHWLADPKVRATLRGIAVISLLAAAAVSPPVQATVPLVLFGFQVYRLLPKRDRILWTAIGLVADYFTFFVLVTYFGPVLGPLAILPALPVLGTVAVALASLARLVPASSRVMAGRWRPTEAAIAIGSITLAVFAFAAVAASIVIAVACAVALAFFVGLGWWARRIMPRPPVAFEPLRIRVLAGNTVWVDVKGIAMVKNIGRISFSPVQEWVRISSDGPVLSSRGGMTLRLSLSPPLSGPSRITLVGVVSDVLGMWTYAFEASPIELQVIPRARYAAWFARRYAGNTRQGVLPLLSTVEISRSNAVGQSGIEYYGGRLYQPGDSIRIIDWKHSIKLAQLVSKEFSELRGERALLLVNLVASNEEAADRLAYNIIATGLTLAHDKIPAAIAAYDHQEPRMVTAVLAPSTLVARALQLSQQVSVSEAPVRYLPSASVMGLMASVLRLRQANDGPARKLAEILDIEFRSLWEAARRSSATEALTRAFAGIGRWCNVVVISGRNHDAEALAFSIYELRRRGTRVVEV